MKLVAVAVVVLLGLCGVVRCATEHPLVPCDPEISDQCPEEDGPYPVYFPVETDCTKFCVCSGGTAYEESCLPGTVWDQDLQICNWPNMVDCGGRPIP